MVDPEFVVGIKPGDSCVVIGDQGDEFTHAFSVEWYIGQSQIYPGFIGKMSNLTHFPLKLGCQGYTFLDHAVDDFNQGMIPSKQILSKHQNWMHSLISLMPLFLQSLEVSHAWLVPFLIILNHSLLLDHIS